MRVVIQGKTSGAGRDGKRIVRSKLWLFAALTAALLMVQYPIGATQIAPAWALAFTILLFHCVVMLADALCELFDEDRPSWADSPLGLLLPVEPRGFPQFVTLVGLIAIMMIAMEIRDCAGISVEGAGEP